nr:MAG TPA: hypothetical protein [Caudoviricetes sp.]
MSAVRSKNNFEQAPRVKNLRNFFETENRWVSSTPEKKALKFLLT